MFKTLRIEVNKMINEELQNQIKFLKELFIDEQVIIDYLWTMENKIVYLETQK